MRVYISIRNLDCVVTLNDVYNVAGPSTSSESYTSHRGISTVHRSSTASTVLPLSRNASKVNGGRLLDSSAGSGSRVPSVSDYNAAMNSSSAFEKDTTAATTSTLLYDDSARLSSVTNNNEMDWTKRSSSLSDKLANDDHKHHNPNDEKGLHQLETVGEDGIPEQGPGLGLRTYLSMEHLDGIGDDDHHHQSSFRHRSGSSKQKHRKHRKFRGKLGGLHRSGDSTDVGEEEEMVELSSFPTASPTTGSQRSSLQAEAAAVPLASEGRNVLRPIYKKSIVGRPNPVQNVPTMASTSSAPRPTATAAAASSIVDSSAVGSSSRVPREGGSTSRNPAVVEVASQGQQHVATDSPRARQSRLSSRTAARDVRKVAGEQRDVAANATIRQASSGRGSQRQKPTSSRGTAPVSYSVTDNGVSSDVASAHTVPDAVRTKGQRRPVTRRTPPAVSLDTSRSTDI